MPAVVEEVAPPVRQQSAWVRRGACLLALLAIAGCVSPVQSKARSPLVRPQLSPDTIVLDVFIVRCPLAAPEVNDQLWAEIDEQHIPAEVRRRLALNGFRAGKVGNQIPSVLSQLLELNERPPPGDGTNKVELGQLATEPRVQRRHMPLRNAMRGEIVASEVYPELSVLISRPGDLSGQTYCQAQAVFGVLGVARPDGLVKLELTPELHHDSPRQRWVGDQGVLRLESCRPKTTFDEMAIAATLAPGEMLIVGCLPNKSGSLGHHFFTTCKEQPQQKLLVVRLAQTQHDGLFTPPDATPR